LTPPAALDLGDRRRRADEQQTAERTSGSAPLGRCPRPRGLPAGPGKSCARFLACSYVRPGACYYGLMTTLVQEHPTPQRAPKRGLICALAVVVMRYPTLSALAVGLAASWSALLVFPIENVNLRAAVACVCGIASYVGWKFSTTTDEHVIQRDLEEPSGQLEEPRPAVFMARPAGGGQRVTMDKSSITVPKTPRT
jgi:hypothetical protein